MQLMNTLPTPEQLALPRDIAKRVVELLIEPFGAVKSAQDYWQTNTTHLVILTDTDTYTSFKSLSDLTQSLVMAANDNPEFVEVLSAAEELAKSHESYHLFLIVYTDAGNGLYLVKPVGMALSNFVKEITL